MPIGVQRQPYDRKSDRPVGGPTPLPDVRQFYESLPFNFDGSTDEQADTVRARNQIAVYEPLDRVLREAPPARVLDIGSGAGWFVNSVARWYGVPACGLDFCDRAVTRAREVAESLGVSHLVDYVRGDLFALPEALQAQRFAVVNSLGVLHHTKDCREACRIAASLVAPGGHFNLGLYHRHGRKPLLDLFEPIRQRRAAAASEQERRDIEAEGFRTWKTLHRSTRNETFLSSWYRDQCFHPHETQWTLREVLEWFDEFGVEPLSTTLNRFQSNPRWADVVADEPMQETLAISRLHEGVFFPGFFTVFGRKR